MCSQPHGANRSEPPFAQPSARSATAQLERPTSVALLPVPASDLEPGMSLLDANGDPDPIESLERVTLGATVHDLDVTPTHNFVANGLVTHNSIYTSDRPTFATSWSSSMTSRGPRW